MTERSLVVGISDRKSGGPPLVFVTYALGSCVGVALYDSGTKIGGLAHVMLPDSGLNTNPSELNRMKYADTAIPDLVDEMLKLGASKERITAKLAGGANMFKLSNDSPIGNIGDRNVEMSKEALKKQGIRIVAEDTGDDFGRTVFFDLSTGILRIQSLGRDTKEI